MALRDLGAGFQGLAPISLAAGQTATDYFAGLAQGANLPGGTGVSEGAAAQYTQQRPIMVEIDIHDNQVFGGSLQEFAQLIRDEFYELGLLNR